MKKGLLNFSEEEIKAFNKAGGFEELIEANNTEVNVIDWLDKAGDERICIFLNGNHYKISPSQITITNQEGVYKGILSFTKRQLDLAKKNIEYKELISKHNSEISYRITSNNKKSALVSIDGSTWEISLKNIKGLPKTVLSTGLLKLTKKQINELDVDNLLLQSNNSIVSFSYNEKPGIPKQKQTITLSLNEKEFTLPLRSIIQNRN